MKLTVTFIIPTLNSAAVLESCLRSIHTQSVFNNNQIIIVDGGSTDSTLNIAAKYSCKIIKNPLKTAEAGKAIGLSHSRTDLVAFIDSDNILPDQNWLANMLLPFTDPEIIGGEPIEFTYRPQAGYIERYSALIGANDPYAFVLGNYDRISKITGRWTGLNLKTQDLKKYIKVEFSPKSALPTIGANGTVFRRSFLTRFVKGDYLFDIDIIAMAPKPLYFAKVKVGIIHTFCESSLKKFFRKQNRRITDFFYYRPLRKYNWNSYNHFGIYKFILYSLFLPWPIIDSFRGFTKIRDSAWFFHPLACIITLYLYGFNSIMFRLNLLRPDNRLRWSQ